MSTSSEERAAFEHRQSYPLAQVAGEDEVSGEGVSKRGVELQHLQQGFPLNDVKVAVS